MKCFEEPEKRYQVPVASAVSCELELPVPGTAILVVRVPGTAVLVVRVPGTALLVVRVPGTALLVQE